MENKEIEMIEHAPGPWFWLVDSDVRVYSGHAKPEEVCWVSDSEGAEAAEANARLIAAAPELLEALEAATEVLNDVGQHTGYKIVMDAIAKAKGAAL